MPDGDLTLRPWRDEDQAGILELERAVWGETEAVDPAFFDWQYRQNPQGRAVIFCCESPEGRIAAQYAVIPIPLRVKGMRITGSLSLNTVTHPDYRRLGLFTKTAIAVYEQLRQQGIVYTLGFPNENSYPGFVRKLDFADLGRPTLLVKIFDFAAFVAGQNVADKWPRFATLVRKVTNGFRRMPTKAIRTCELPTFERLRIEQLWEPHDVIVAADAKWLTWRYVKNPIANYKIIVAPDEKDPDALLVLRNSVLTRKGRIGYIMELMLKKEADLEVAQALISQAVADFEADSCAAVCFLASPGSRKVNLLKQCGFWEVPATLKRIPPLILRKHMADGWDIVLRDVDVSFGMFDTL